MRDQNQGHGSGIEQHRQLVLARARWQNEAQKQQPPDNLAVKILKGAKARMQDLV